jgi:hypothetical protein
LQSSVSCRGGVIYYGKREDEGNLPWNWDSRDGREVVEFKQFEGLEDV